MLKKIWSLKHIAGMCMVINCFAISVVSLANPPAVKIVAKPNTLTLMIGAEPVLLTAIVDSAPVTFAWELNGPGEFKGDIQAQAIFYVPPKTLPEKTASATISVRVTNATHQETVTSLTLALRVSPPLTVNPAKLALLGVGAAGGVGAMIALAQQSGGSEADTFDLTGRWKMAALRTATTCQDGEPASFPQNITIQIVHNKTELQVIIDMYTLNGTIDADGNFSISFYTTDAIVFVSWIGHATNTEIEGYLTMERRKFLCNETYRLTGTRITSE